MFHEEPKCIWTFTTVFPTLGSGLKTDNRCTTNTGKYVTMVGYVATIVGEPKMKQMQVTPWRN
jgi:hypothetical protein